MAKRISNEEMEKHRKIFTLCEDIGDALLDKDKDGYKDLLKSKKNLRENYTKLEERHASDEYDRGWWKGFWWATGCIYTGLIIGEIIVYKKKK